MDADETLARRAAAGDAQAFTMLFDRHRDKVFRLALSILGQAFVGEAEEMTQEVFLRVHHALKSFRGQSKFSTWLYRVTFNQTINLKARVRFTAPHVSDQALGDEPVSDPDALTQLARARRDAALDECIAELPEAYQSALRLHYWMGETVADIATLLDVPENTVKSYLFRSRQLLQVMLQNRGYDGV